MILAIVAWAAPSAAGAHDGHGHHGHHRAAADAPQAQPSIAVEITQGVRIAAPDLSASAVAGASGAAASLRSGDAERGDGPGEHGPCCCGAACCAPGILAAVVTLSEPAPGRAVLRLGDVPARAGFGPEALNEPPRSLA